MHACVHTHTHTHTHTFVPLILIKKLKLNVGLQETFQKFMYVTILLTCDNSVTTQNL